VVVKEFLENLLVSSNPPSPWITLPAKVGHESAYRPSRQLNHKSLFNMVLRLFVGEPPTGVTGELLQQAESSTPENEDRQPNATD
jgi:hypothetical protein